LFQSGNVLVILAPARETVAAGVTSHDEGVRVNLIKKMLAAPAVVLALWAVSAQAATNDDIAKRLEPVGQVCVQGQECKGMEVAASAGGGGGAKTPDEVIAKHCNACHGTGLLGSPKIGDTAAWKERADHQGGLDGILAKAITGINSMPPKGTCADCSDAELKGAIQKMSGLK
jgi:cytochrome c5